MSQQESYSISELEEQTGQARRTIHHYVSRGLLPKAEGQGPKAYYTREHYLRLRLISLLVEAGIGTDLIQSSLEGWSLDDMERLVSLAEGKRLDDLDKLSRWLTASEMSLPQDFRAYASAMPASNRDTIEPDLAQESDGGGEPAARRIADDLSRWAEQRDFMRADRAHQNARQQNLRMPFREESAPIRARDMTRLPRIPKPDAWERIRIGEDLEISYRARAGRTSRRKLDELQQFVQHLFAEEIQASREADRTEEDGTTEEDDIQA